jgi:hypothetical protein
VENNKRIPTIQKFYQKIIIEVLNMVNVKDLIIQDEKYNEELE